MGRWFKTKRKDIYTGHKEDFYDFLQLRVARHWSRMLREVVAAPSLDTLKVRLD